MEADLTALVQREVAFTKEALASLRARATEGILKHSETADEMRQLVSQVRPCQYNFLTLFQKFACLPRSFDRIFAGCLKGEGQGKAMEKRREMGRMDDTCAD